MKVAYHLLCHISRLRVLQQSLLANASEHALICNPCIAHTQFLCSPLTALCCCCCCRRRCHNVRQSYFEQHSIPASVVLKLLAFFSASPEDQARVLACGSPKPAAFATQ
jgi:hypothetical protein